MLKAVFFDLDGTLLPMDEKEFTEGYFKYLLKKVSSLGYTKETLIPAIWDGIYAMYLNDGSKPNSEAFWERFSKDMGEDKRKDEPVFADFYRNEFRDAVKVYCHENPMAKDVVTFCKKNLCYTVLSTNAIFPAEGQRSRIEFLGMEPEDFDYVTDYSNSCYCKPNPMFFKVLLDRFHLKPEEVIVFGNNTYEDGDCASALGLKVYLVKGFLIHSEKAKGTYPEIEFSQIVDIIKQEMKQN